MQTTLLVALALLIAGTALAPTAAAVELGPPSQGCRPSCVGDDPLDLLAGPPTQPCRPSC